MKNIDIARARVRMGAVFLDEHFPGWREYLRTHWDQVCMIEAQHCVLATVGHMVPGRPFTSSGDVVRMFRGVDLGNPAFGFYEDQKEGVSYKELELAWKELLFEQPDPPLQLPKPHLSIWRRMWQSLFPSRNAIA